MLLKEEPERITCGTSLWPKEEAGITLLHCNVCAAKRCKQQQNLASNQLLNMQLWCVKDGIPLRETEMPRADFTGQRSTQPNCGVNTSWIWGGKPKAAQAGLFHEKINPFSERAALLEGSYVAA